MIFLRNYKIKFKINIKIIDSKKYAFKKTKHINKDKKRMGCDIRISLGHYKKLYMLESR